MTEQDRMTRILEKLAEIQEDKPREWVEDANLSTAFWADVGDWRIRIYSVDGDGEHPYRLSIFGPREDADPEIEGIASRPIDPNSETVEADRLVNRNLASVYATARGVALGVTQALTEIESLLDEDA